MPLEVDDGLGHGPAWRSVLRLPPAWPATAQHVFALTIVALSLLGAWALAGLVPTLDASLLVIAVLVPLLALVRSGPFLAAASLAWTGVVFLLPLALASTPRAQLLSHALEATLLLLAIVAGWLARRSLDARDEPPTTSGSGARHITRGGGAGQREHALAAQAFTATAKFHSVFNQSGIFAGITDLDGTLREANVLSLKACGYRADEVIGLPFWETPWWRGSPEVQATIREAVQRARAGDAFTAMLPFWLADGSERLVDFAMHPIRDEAGGVLFLHPTGIDVTERMHVETLLRRNHETFFNLVQNSPFGIYVVDADFKLRQVGKGAQRVFENVHPLLGRDFAEVLRQIWVEPFASEAIARFRHTLATGEPYVAVDTTEHRQDLDAVESYDWRIERITLPDGQFGVVCYFYDLTDIKQAQEELRYRSQQFQTLIDRAPLGVLLVDADFRLAQVNPAGMPAFTGIADLIQRPLDEVMRILWPAARADEIVGVFRRTLATGDPHHMRELEEVRADRGVVEYYDWRVDRITLPDGRFGVVCYFRDISEQVLTRRAIADSEMRYRTLFESIDEAFCVLEVIFDDRDKPIDFRYLEINPAFEEQSGLHGALGKRATEILEHEPHWFETYGRVALTGEPVRFQNRAQALNRWFDVYAFRLGPPEERRVAALFRDITAQRRAQESIRFQARLLDAVGQAVIVTDPDGVIIYWNRAAEDLYGWSRQEAMGRRVFDLTVASSTDAQASDIVSRVRAGESWSGEFEVRCRTGTRPALVTNSPMFDEEGRLTAIIGISVDISELKTVQRALQEADRRKDEFLATLAHELRNPLAAIRMALGVLSRGQNDPAHVERMRTIIDRQSAQLVRLIDDLLDVSRITRGKVELRREPVALARTIEHAVEGVAGTCETKGVRLSVALPDRPLVIDADALRFAQVLSNLLNNACKFTSSGGAIEVWAERVGPDAVVHVRDTGAGIPREELSRVFEMFTQIGATGGSDGGGLGIGLSLAKSIVTLHEGSIEARSDGLGCGSEFIVRIPALPEEASIPGETVTRGVGGPVDHHKGSVLAVDDNRDALDAVTLMLQMAGYAVVTGADGHEAFELARTHRPAAVLLDIGLPGIDGYEVARRIRREPWGAGTRLVAMTGWGQERDKQMAHEAGFDAHLTKPVDAEELVRVLGNFSDRQIATGG